MIETKIKFNDMSSCHIDKRTKRILTNNRDDQNENPLLNHVFHSDAADLGDQCNCFFAIFFLLLLFA